MTKRIDNREWKTWGIEGRLPEGFLERASATRYLYVPYIYKQAKAHVDRVLLDYLIKGVQEFRPTTYKKLREDLLQQALAGLDPDPARDNLFQIGAILDHAFVIQLIDEYLQEEAGIVFFPVAPKT